MNIYLALFDILIVPVYLYLLFYARRRGALGVAEIISGTLFGLILEWATIEQLRFYSYGEFLMMIGEIPLSIGMAWGIIIYTVRLFSDSLSISQWKRPVLEGLLVLNIDLAMDAIAIRLGMWNWGIPIEDQFFGVPWGNFWAWFWVVFSFSAGWRFIASRGESRLVKALTPAGALLAGLAGVMATNAFITFLVPDRYYPPVVWATLLAAVVLVAVSRPRLSESQLPPVIIIVPAFFHGYFLVAGLVSGAVFAPDWILLVSLLMIGISLWLHRGIFHKKQCD